MSNEEFSDENVPASNWFAFETIGNQIKGTLINKYDKPGANAMPAQVIFELINCEVNGEAMDPEETWNVGIKASNTFVLGRMKNIKIGQRIGFMFEKEVEPKTKGHHPAKSIKPFAWAMDENYKPEAMAAEDEIDDSDPLA